MVSSASAVLPSISVIICSSERPSLLVDAVRAVLDGDLLPDELLVVDQSVRRNGAVDSLAAGDDPIRYLHSDSTALSVARNLGVSLAVGDVLVFIDDDVLVAKGWLRQLVEALRVAGPRAAVTGRVVAGQSESEGAFAPSLHPGLERRVYRGRCWCDPLATFNFAILRSLYQEVRGFDTRIGPGTDFPAAEDNDFGARLLARGGLIVFEPSAVVHHRAWRDPGAYLALRRSYGRGQGAFYAKHLSAGQTFFLPKLLYAMGRHARQMLTTERQVARGEAAWIWSLIRGGVAWWRLYEKGGR